MRCETLVSPCDEMVMDPVDTLASLSWTHQGGQVNRHRDLPVWQAARRLVVEVYALTRRLPHEEQFVAITQLRRAAWSVANNIAEGNARRGRGELRQFFNVAIGSLAEVDAMLDVLPDLYPIEQQALTTIEALRQEITRGLFGILRRNTR